MPVGNKVDVTMKLVKTLFKLISVINLSLILIACGSGGGSVNGGGSNPLQLTTLHGSVGDGPVVGASIRVYSQQGELLAEHTSDSAASYELKVSAKKSAYPLTVTSTGGLDIVTRRAPDFTMTSYVQNPGDRKRSNINPFSTLIHKTAKAMSGGLSAENIETSKGHVLKHLNFGYDSSVMPDPVTTQVDKNNVALIIRSSEVFGEMVRRARDSMRTNQPTIDGDAIIESLAADMTDGAVDGAGATGTDPRTAAVANVASMQVLLESMRGELKVDGVDAKVLMNDAIKTSLPTEQVDITVYDVAINAEMIAQAKSTLEAVKVLDSSSVYTDLENELNNVAEGMLPADADAIISVDGITSLDSTLVTTVDADDQTLASANTAITNQEPSPEPTSTNAVPSIGGIPAANVQEGDSYYFAPVASDADGDALSFSIANIPSWASFNSTNGAITGTPAGVDAGSTSGISISVSDGTATVSLPAFSITVTSIPNTAPTISGSPAASVQVASAYSFAPSAADADSDSLSFGITNKPLWASFNTATGQLSGTPNVNNIGVTSSIRISVSDGTDTVSLSAFSITVTGIPNVAPVISGTPANTVEEGVGYSFAPTASDADGQSLSFSITNKPAWLTFNASTGALTGTPGSNDVGSTTNIRITVTDGIATASLPEFSVNVTAVVVATTGSATLSWTPPTENTDSSALTNLAGYKIYYGTSAGNYTSTINLANPGLTSYVVDNLAGRNTYYFVITAYDADGNESGYSSMGSKTI